MTFPPILLWLLRRLLRRLVRRQFGKWTACGVSDRIPIAVEIIRELDLWLDQQCHEPR